MVGGHNVAGVVLDGEAHVEKLPRLQENTIN